MPDITKGDIQREIECLREAVERDPEKYGALQMLLENPPGDDYDPNQISPSPPSPPDEPAN